MTTSTPSLMIVVVAYRRRWNDLAPIASLRRLCAATEGIRLEPHQILVYENGDEPSLGADAVAQGYHYVADRSNGGTRAAYLAGRALSLRQDLRWLLLLDHDTIATEAYFSTLAHAIEEESTAASSVGTIVPLIYDGDTLISPSRVHYAGRLTPQREHGSDRGCSSAIASGSAFLGTAFDRLAPLPERYGLDGLDHWMFWTLQRKGFTIRILATRLEHALSVRDLPAVSTQRYASIVASEVRLANDTMRPAERLVFRMRLLWRAAVLVGRKLPAHARIALAAAFRSAA